MFYDNTPIHELFKRAIALFWKSLNDFSNIRGVQYLSPKPLSLLYIYYHYIYQIYHLFSKGTYL